MLLLPAAAPATPPHPKTDRRPSLRPSRSPLGRGSLGRGRESHYWVGPGRAGNRGQSQFPEHRQGTDRGAGLGSAVSDRGPRLCLGHLGTYHVAEVVDVVRARRPGRLAGGRRRPAEEGVPHHGAVRRRQPRLGRPCNQGRQAFGQLGGDSLFLFPPRRKIFSLLLYEKVSLVQMGYCIMNFFEM